MKTLPTLPTLPRIVRVNDYHELNTLPYNVFEYIGIKVKCKELGWDSSWYYGVVYQGAFPDKKIIDKLLKIGHIDLNQNERSGF